MKNVPDSCVTETSDSVIKFQEKKNIIRFKNPHRAVYKRVIVDGCAIKQGEKCDNLLCSDDEREEYFVELKGSDVVHAIDQLRTSITKLGEYNDKRKAYIICTKVAPQISTKLQRAKLEFKDRFKSELIVAETPLDVNL